MRISVALVVLFTSLLAFHESDGAKILGVFPYPSRSHSILGQALFTELAQRGHAVTYLSPYPFKDSPHKNYRDIGITNQGLFDAFQVELDASFEDTDANMVMLLKFWFDNVAEMQEQTFSDPAVQKLLHSNEKFDLCVIEFLMNEALLGFGARFGCKIVAVSTIGQVKYLNDMMHSPLPLSVTPHPFLPFTDKMTFAERFQNVITNTIEDIGYAVYHYPLQNAIYDKYFTANFPGLPSFQYMLRNSVSLALLNTHFSLNYPQAYLPNMIEIGGFHVKKETNPLPEDIEKFIRGAEHGVIYFSLGGNLKPSKMSADKKRAIYAALAKLKQKVIWKWDEELTMNVKDKFLVRKWLPQDDILAHPNVKLFVTHGGLLSCTEAILRGKPIVGIPIFGDQMMNMARAELLGWGTQVTYKNLTAESLSWAIKEVINNKKYTENVKMIAKRLMDQPQTPMEKAIFWIEYVLRNDGAPFMKTSARHLDMIEYHNLDVYAVLALGAFVASAVLFLVIFIIFKLMCSSRSQPKASAKKKKN